MSVWDEHVRGTDANGPGTCRLRRQAAEFHGHQSDSGSYVLNLPPMFVPGPGFITPTRISEGDANPFSGSPFGSVTAKYDKVAAVTVTWT